MFLIMEETKMKTKKEVNFTIYNPQKWLVLLTNNPKIYGIDFEDVCKANGRDPRWVAEERQNLIDWFESWLELDDFQSPTDVRGKPLFGIDFFDYI